MGECAQAMSLMLPKDVGRRQIPDAATLESRMDCMRITSSYSCAALNNVHLDSILDDIKCNLRKEQRTVMELNYMTMHKVLTPIQVNFTLSSPLLKRSWGCLSDPYLAFENPLA